MKQLAHLFLLLILSLPYQLWTQTPQQNLEKYWVYRQRFLQHFIRLGTAAGESVPINGLGPQMDCDNWFIQHQNCQQRKGKGMLFWGDTTIDLGQYIATLAVMVRNLQDADQAHQEELQELYLAIKAFERIDYHSETYFGVPPAANGFFIRDDVPADFLYNEKGEKRFNMKNGRGQYSCLISHGSCNEKDMINGNVASLDQIMSLMLGFALTVELLPHATYQEVDISELAALQVHRIVSFLSDNNWKIRMPNGKVPPPKWGGDCIAFSHDLALAARRLTRNKYDTDYRNARSKCWGKMIVGTFSWAHWAQTQRNQWMAYVAVICSGRWNAKKLARKAKKKDRPVFSLAYCAINRASPNKHIQRKKIETMLNTAPWGGPCFKTPGCTAPNGWKGPNRWIEPKRNNGNPYGRNYEYNGLDYMLLYNLYHLIYKDIIDLPKYAKSSNK